MKKTMNWKIEYKSYCALAEKDTDVCIYDNICALCFKMTCTHDSKYYANNQYDAVCRECYHYSMLVGKTGRL